MSYNYTVVIISPFREEYLHGLGLSRKLVYDFIAPRMERVSNALKKNAG